MIDIVQRLRQRADQMATRGNAETLREAADEIDRLRTSERSAWNAAVTRDEEIERLRVECGALRDEADLKRAALVGTSKKLHAEIERQRAELATLRAALADSARQP